MVTATPLVLGEKRVFFKYAIFNAVLPFWSFIFIKPMAIQLFGLLDGTTSQFVMSISYLLFM